MNEYIKIPRGIHVIATNDHILKKLIEYLGRTYNHTLKGTFRSDYAKGKAYLSRKCNMSKSAIKCMHKVKISSKSREEYGDSYSNIVKINTEHFADFFKVMIAELINKDIDVLSITWQIHKGEYTPKDKYITFLFEETKHWMNWATRDENFAEFNSSNEAYDVLISMISECGHMNEIIGERK